MNTKVKLYLLTKGVRVVYRVGIIVGYFKAKRR